jgi:16S rRNA (uracil1498-N3)-methyltransferase
MTTTPRLYVDATLAQGGNATLSEAQAHYLKNVLRRSEGDEVLLFNARDGEFAAVLEALGKKKALTLVKEKRRAPADEPDLWLLFAAVKRDAVDLIVEKATELGVSLLQPVTTERTNAARVKEDRLAAIATEAAEQSGRLSVPTIEELAPLAALLEHWPADRRLMFCDEAGDNAGEEWGGGAGRAAPVLDALRDKPQGKWAILIGPEGGFSPAERARLRECAFVTPVTLGPRILKADTAALAALALWQAALGDFTRR